MSQKGAVTYHCQAGGTGMRKPAVRMLPWVIETMTNKGEMAGKYQKD